MPYATVNGIRMHYETHGAGDPVLLISGLGGPGVGWLFQVRDLSPRYHVITFDNRGVGETDMPRELRYATGELAEDARALLDHLNVKRAHVIGASMGGTIAMELADPVPGERQEPHPVLHVGGGGRPLPAHDRVMARAGAPALARGSFPPPALPVALLARLPRRLRARGGRRQACARLSVPHQGRRDRAARPGAGRVERDAAARAGQAPGAGARAGGDDILTPPVFSRRLAALIPDAKLKILPGGHAFFIEEVPRFNRALLAFLAGVKK